MRKGIFFSQNMTNQSGAVLITTLVLLLILTLLGLTTMTTSTIEERMAANSQEVSRSFHAADAGLTTAFSNPDDLSSGGTGTGDDVTLASATVEGYKAKAEYIVGLRAITPLGRSDTATEIWSADFAKYHFELRSTGDSSGVQTVLTGGIVQIAPALTAD